MTPEQRKCVAEVIYPSMSAEICGERIFFDDCWDDRWHPSFTGDLHQRSQALAVVEWLMNAIEALDFSGAKISQMKMYELFTDVGLFVKAKDIESLLSLVLELSDE